MKYALRILAVPFVLGILVVSSVFHVLKRTFYFLKYGGELMNYDPVRKPATIDQVYLKVCELVEEKK